MSREDYQIIMQRYETYCHAFISIAGQVKHIEDTHGLDLTETKNTMWALLEQIVLDKPDWSRQVDKKDIFKGEKYIYIPSEKIVTVYNIHPHIDNHYYIRYENGSVNTATRELLAPIKE